jgi:hypothetical protein
MYAARVRVWQGKQGQLPGHKWSNSVARRMNTKTRNYPSMASGPWETGPATDHKAQHHNMGPKNNNTSNNKVISP